MVKDLPANAGDSGSIPGSGRSPGEGNGSPLQYSCMENPMDYGARPWGHKELDVTEHVCHRGLGKKRQEKDPEVWGPSTWNDEAILTEMERTAGLGNND